VEGTVVLAERGQRNRFGGFESSAAGAGLLECAVTVLAHGVVR
jgi:hypothetical protein